MGNKFAYVNKERTKTGRIVAELPKPKKGHKYKIIPSNDGYFDTVFVVDVEGE